MVLLYVFAAIGVLSTVVCVGMTLLVWRAR